MLEEQIDVGGEDLWIRILKQWIDRVQRRDRPVCGTGVRISAFALRAMADHAIGREDLLSGGRIAGHGERRARPARVRGLRHARGLLRWGGTSSAGSRRSRATR